MTATGPLSRHCPRCQAKRGNPCTTTSGRPTYPHTARRALAKGQPTPGNADTGGQHLRLLDPQVHDGLINAIRLGTPINLACASVGIHTATLYRWIALAENDDTDAQPYREFRDELMRARGLAAARHVALINESATRTLKKRVPAVGPDGKVLYGRDGEMVYEEVYEKDWRASAFLLERGFAREFGRRETVELSGADAVLPVEAGGGPAGGVGALDGPGLERVLANLAAFKARKELEAARSEGRVVEGEVIDPAGHGG